MVKPCLCNASTSQKENKVLEETSVLPESWRKRPEPSSDASYEESEAKFTKAVDFFMPNSVFNKAEKGLNATIAGIDKAVDGIKKILSIKA